jgi:hypothetical protein
MNDKVMREKVEQVLRELEVRALEERIAPVKCDKNPEAPECGIVAEYGVSPMYGVEEDPVVRYGIGF